MNTLDFLRANEHKSERGFLSEAQYLKDNWGWLKYSYAIAIKVRSRMSELGWTQKQLAEALNCTQQHISVLLNGRVNMTLETLAKLEDALKFNLIGGDLVSFPNTYSQQRTPSYLNSPEFGEVRPDVDTSALVDGYPKRKKKGPKK